MQRFEVRPTEVALHFYECARAHCWLLRPEVIVSHGAKGEPVLITARRLVGLWIRTCGDCAESLLCCRPCCGIERSRTCGVGCRRRAVGLRIPAKVHRSFPAGRASPADGLIPC